MLSAIFAQAKEQTIVVKKDPLSSKGNTEVKIEQGNESDTIVIVPGVNVTDVEVTISDTSGNTIAQYFLPADSKSPINMTTPDLPDYYMVEVRDNHGVVFSEYEYQ